MQETGVRRSDVLALGALLLAFWSKVLLPLLFTGRLPTDFLSFYLAARWFFEGNVYDVSTLEAAARAQNISAHIFPYLYPPVLAFYLQPLALLPPVWAARLWLLLTALLLAPILWWTYRLAFDGDLPWLLWGWVGLLLIALPFDNNIRMGQANILVMFFMVGGIYAVLRANREALGGALLTVATLLKLVPGVLFIYLLLERRYRSFVGLFIGLLLVVLPTWIAGGGRVWRNFWDFSRHTGYGHPIPGLFGPETWPNFSPLGFWARLLNGAPLTAILSGISAGVLLGLVIWVHYSRGQGDSSGAILLAYFVCMILLSPYTYLHHIVYLFPAAVLLLYRLRTYRHGAVWGSLLFVGLIGAGVDWPAYYRYFPLFSHVSFLTSLNLYALLLIWAVALGVARRPTVDL